MLTSEFYDIIDQEIDQILTKHKGNKYLASKKDKAGQKSFGFLLWFIQRYNPNLKEIASFVTDGNDDSSCDIIFPNKDNFGEEIYYVVQSKWNERQNINGAGGTTNIIKACLNDFALILSSEVNQIHAP